MPTVDETGRWDFEPTAMPLAPKAAPRLAAAHAKVERAQAEYRLIARDVAMTARLARAAIGTPNAQILFGRVNALHAVSASAFAALRRAELAYERERRADRLRASLNHRPRGDHEA
jgi:hypothetical protein